MLSEDEGRLILKIARDTVKNYLENERSEIKKTEFKEKLGVFVTIHKHGKLRGCIGYPYPTHVLVEALIDSAINAALHDPRFLPININELNNLIFEVSVLTPPKIIETNKPLEYPKYVEIGQDGLIVERGLSKGLLLPQVPLEWNWNIEEFISHCCLKAGLSPSIWMNKDTKIYKFQAIIFEEETPHGQVKRKSLV